MLQSFQLKGMNNVTGSNMNAEHFLCQSRIPQLFNFKEAKESNNAAGITKNAVEQFLCQSRILQFFNFKEAKESNNAAGITKIA